MAACGDSDEAATAAVGTGEIEESTSSTVIDTNTSGVEPTTQTTNAQTTTSATDEESTTTETTVAEPDPDELAELINRQAFTVPQSNTRCGHILEGGGAFSGLLFDYQDPSDGGDFFVLCLVTASAPTRIDLVLTGPDGSVHEATAVPLGGDVVQISGQDVNPLIVVSGGESRYNGVVEAAPADGTVPFVSQVHLWLPHDRLAGQWTARANADTATFDVRAPCATGPPAGVDPFVIPVGIAFLRSSQPGGVNVTDHCAFLVDVAGQDITVARDALQTVADNRGANLEFSTSPVCDQEPVGVVLAQEPPPGSWPARKDLDSDLIVIVDVATGPCVDDGDEGDETTTTSTSEAITTTTDGS
jgi:hypothetical protein